MSRKSNVVDFRAAQRRASERSAEAVRREWEANQAALRRAMERSLTLYRELSALGVRVG